MLDRPHGSQLCSDGAQEIWKVLLTEKSLLSLSSDPISLLDGTSLNFVCRCC